MHSLLEAEQFVSVASTLLDAAAAIKGSSAPILLLAAPSLAGALSLAPIEAALLDSGLPYRRRFRLEAPEDGAWVHIQGPGNDAGPSFRADPPQLTIAGEVVEGLHGHGGDVRRGPLTTVAQAHALAQAIAPKSQRLKRMRPWLISGNWLHSALDTTYDPVFTALRDMLVEEGTVSVVALPEVVDPDLSATPWIEPLALEAISARWPTLDLEGRARSLSHLMRPVLASSTPSTARMEELGWHRVVAANWKSDLASQITRSARMWKKRGASAAAGELVDSLLRSGQAPSFEPQD
jgi:hypothetical protein